ncbi:polyphosphate kinase 2 [Thioalkalivibrio sp. ALE11]|uniref:polyphosphate kinase 2 n=1 Tax=Thioalkalivibrio sp. ALE11 TaxID=1265494 RepID=UPI00037EA168|nr:polyphosphate kinase 2 [Thioalkalivibrio sp. ALE11]
MADGERLRRFYAEDYNKEGVLRRKVYERELRRLQVELIKLQRCVKAEGRRVVILFEGRDAAGKGGVIKRIMEKSNPRIVRTVALGKPSDHERGQWYFQRYAAHLPTAGEIVLFDRSWYNRAGVERVMGFASEEEVQRFLHACPTFERLLVEDGIELYKYWFSVSEQEQERRFQARVEDPVKRWKLSPMDLKSRELWHEFSKAKDDMLRHTDTAHAPWRMVDADIKRHARLNCIADILENIPYSDHPPEKPKLEPRVWAHDQEARGPLLTGKYIPARY